MTDSKVKFTQQFSDSAREIFNSEAIEFLSACSAKFAKKRAALLEQRSSRQELLAAGGTLDFDPSTLDIRQGDWKVDTIPAPLTNRRVEITGPVDRKMIINALNTPVNVFMADFEDSLSPTWNNVVQGQINMRDANRRTISFSDEKSGKQYKLRDELALLLCRVRGLHLDEKHILWEGSPIPGGLVDFSMYLFHNHEQLKKNGIGPYFYIPKLEHASEAAWWNEVFRFAEEYLGLSRGTIKVTCLIETLPAVFQMHEILHALKDYIVALNCGRWDYIFSYIKTLRHDPSKILPNRSEVTMRQPFLEAYSKLLIDTCHMRGALAMGGMAALIPSKDPDENQKILSKVEDDKQLEASRGHDGTWIAHPGLAQKATEVFNEFIPNAPNQMGKRIPEAADITAQMLTAPCEGSKTLEGMRTNIRVSLLYIQAWLDGNGCVPIYGLMEDAATAEISRASIWQWIEHSVQLDSGEIMTKELFEQLLEEEYSIVKAELGERFNAEKFQKAKNLFHKMTVSEEFGAFLTLEGYRII